mmetsp:Transcript_5290/g.11985  ORF Transcript_5290/g.11985 Transcript_5290/m.11985 type:complete len:582 (-) Transcript_5290:231-1976(-)
MVGGGRFVCAILLVALVTTPSEAVRLGDDAATMARTDVMDADVGRAFLHGIEAWSKSSELFTQDPPDIEGGLEVLHRDLWQIVEIVVPESEQGTQRFQEGEKAFHHLFQAAKQGIELRKDILTFAREGDTEALVSGMGRILQEVTELSEDYFPGATKYLHALRDFSDGVGEGWTMYGSGNVDGALVKIWDSLKIAVDELVPDDVQNQQTYQLVMGTVDGVVGEMSRHILEYQRAIQSSKLCYKRTVHREQVRPRQCQEGFAWDQGHLCWPDATSGANCWGPCGGMSGMCESFCGAGKACCRLHDRRDAPECQAAKGYVNNHFTSGSPGEYHQCVRPGPALAFSVQGCGEFRANGFWVWSGKHSGRPKYTKVHDTNMVIEWSNKRNAWRMYLDEKFFHVNRDTLYQSAEDTSTIPTAGWEVALGLGSPPTFILLEPEQAEVGLAQVKSSQNQSDVGPWDSPVGTHEATCDMDSEYNEKSGHWCLKPCPAGYVNSGGVSCKQTCGGKYPAEGMGGICAIDHNEVTMATSQMALELALGALDVVATYEKAREQGVDVKSLTKTANILIDMGKNFAHPQCPETME